MNRRATKAAAVTFGTVVGVITLLVALAAFAAVFKWMAYEFTLPRNDLVHGWLIPPITIYLVWRRRGELRQAARRPDLRGLIAVVAGLMLFWLGHRGGQLRLSQLAMIWEVWAIPFALYGAAVGRLMVFPALFLLFCVPLGFLDFITTPLRSVTVEVTSALLRGLGINVVREANGVRAIGGSGFQLDVSDPCSGLYSLFGIGAFTCAYAFTTMQGRLRQWLLFLSAAPLAVIGNAVRIFTIMLVAHFFGNGVVTDYYHDFSPWVIYLVSFLLMFRFAAWLRCQPRRQIEARLDAWGGRGKGECREADHAKWQGRDKALAIVVPVLLVGVSVLQAFLPRPHLDEADFIRMELPATIAGLPGDEPLYCHNEQCLVRTMRSELPDDGAAVVCPHCGGALFAVSRGEATKLPHDTLQVKRVYSGFDNLTIDVSLVLSGGSRMSIHRPELCIPSQGFHMSRVRQLPVAIPGRAPLVAHMVAVEKHEARFVLCYWFVSRNFETSSHTVRILRDAWSRSVYNRISRWVMCVVVINRAIDAPGTTELVAETVSEVCQGIKEGSGAGNGLF